MKRFVIITAVLTLGSTAFADDLLEYGKQIAEVNWIVSPGVV